MEFQVIHPVGSVHIPLSSLKFVTKVQDVMAKNPDKKYAFYCNGITCLKSYKATRKMINTGCKTCYVYDAGIPEWAEIYPKLTMLLNEKVSESKLGFIPKADFKKKCLPFEKFLIESAAKGSLLIDARDYIQASSKLLGMEKAKRFSFSTLIPMIIKKKKHQDKTLYIFDQVGKQVRWLMYYLEKYGYKNYYFLSKGATGVLKSQKYRGKL